MDRRAEKKKKGGKMNFFESFENKKLFCEFIEKEMAQYSSDLDDWPLYALKKIARQLNVSISKKDDVLTARSKIRGILRGYGVTFKDVLRELRSGLGVSLDTLARKFSRVSISEPEDLKTWVSSDRSYLLNGE